MNKSASEILSDIALEVNSLQLSNEKLKENHDLIKRALTQTTEESNLWMRKYYQAYNCLKKLSNSLKHMNINQSSEQECKDKLKTIRLILEGYDA